jgi:hypothetical protein
VFDRWIFSTGSDREIWRETGVSGCVGGEAMHVIRWRFALSGKSSWEMWRKILSSISSEVARYFWRSAGTSGMPSFVKWSSTKRLRRISCDSEKGSMAMIAFTRLTMQGYSI